MYEKYFGLKEKPFRITPDPRFLYLSEKHGEALDHLIYGIRQGEGFMVITGDVGTGKTTVVRSLLEQLDGQQIKTAVVLNPLLDLEELLKTVLEDFGLSPRGNHRKELIDQLNSFLLSLNREGKQAVVIIDEAQNLTPQLLEELRSLSNLETDQEKLLQIVLVGQLELWKQLNRPELRQLQQRISVRYRIGPLSFQETKAYIAHRLQVAGAGEAIIFSGRALRRIYRLSGGIPRLINLICDRTLLVLFTEQKKEAGPAQVRKALESLRGGHKVLFFFGNREWRLWTVGSLALVLLLVGAGYFLGFPSQKFSAVEATVVPLEGSVAKDPSPQVFYTVHLASFRKQKTAEQVIEKVCRKGLEAFGIVYEHPETGKWYRVVAGQFAGKGEALSLAERLRKDGSFPLALVIPIPANTHPFPSEKKGQRS